MICALCHRYGHEADEDSLECLYRTSDDTCPDCGERMTWCSSCMRWSQTCCVDWGTCSCS